MQRICKRVEQKKAKYFSSTLRASKCCNYHTIEDDIGYEGPMDIRSVLSSYTTGDDTHVNHVT